MTPCLDYMTAADRLGTSLAAKLASAIAYLRYRNKYRGDVGCPFIPTPAKATDVRRTMVMAMLATIDHDSIRLAHGLSIQIRDAA